MPALRQGNIVMMDKSARREMASGLNDRIEANTESPCSRLDIQKLAQSEKTTAHQLQDNHRL